jgi:AcrR family transcriptional regulator
MKDNNRHSLTLQAGTRSRKAMTQDTRSAKQAALSLDAQETRKRILAEAERLFRVYGYSKTTVADIAEACRMSPANVYRFFESKSAINNAICERMLGEIDEALGAIARLPVAAPERLKRFILELNRWSMENLIDKKKVHEMVMVAMDERWEAIQAHIHRISDLLATIIENGIARGEFRQQDAKHAAKCASTAFAPLCHPVLLAQRVDDPDKATGPEMADFIISALK